MEAVKEFLRRISEDARIGQMHISLFVTIAALAPDGGVFQVQRQELMKTSKIMGKTTYYKCLKELKEWGYIGYWPEHGVGGSFVRTITKFQVISSSL